MTLAQGGRLRFVLCFFRLAWVLFSISGFSTGSVLWTASASISSHLLPMRCDEVDPNRDVVVICHHGGRSMQVAMFLERKGFGSVLNLSGGVEAWAGEVDSSMRRY